MLGSFQKFLRRWSHWGLKRVRPSLRSKLNVLALEDRLAPAFLGGVTVASGDLNRDGFADLVTGAMAGGGPHVRAFSGADGSELFSFYPYDPNFQGGVSVGVGDVTGDGYGDIVTGAGPGGGSHVKVFDGKSGREVLSFIAFDPGFLGGVSVATGDFDGDGIDEIVTGAGPGGGPHVKVFESRILAERVSLFAYADSFVGGVSVATGDVNADGQLDLVTGAGPGGGPHVKVFDGNTFQAIRSIFAYAPNFEGGVHVATGDVDGDGRLEIVTAAGQGGGPHIRAFDQTGKIVRDFMASELFIPSGATVAMADLNGDGTADFITGVDPGLAAEFRAFDGRTGNAVMGTAVYGGVTPGGFWDQRAQRAKITDQGLEIPPADSDTATVSLRVAQLSTDFSNAVGLYRTDDSSGRVGYRLPGDTGYAAAALADDRRVGIEDQSGFSFDVKPGEHYGFYLIQNATLTDWWTKNSANLLQAGPLAFFSFAQANPDGVAHGRTVPGWDRYAWEDITYGGDGDFNDLILDIATSTSPATIPPTAPPGVPPTIPPTIPPTVPKVPPTSPPPVVPPTIPPVSPPLPPITFPSDLVGWTVAERGGSAAIRGTVTVQSGQAILKEGDSFITTLSKSFVVPTTATSIQFTYADLGFDTTNGGFVNDAFEAALLDAAGKPLVPVYSSGRDAFFNVTDGNIVATGAATTISGKTINVDLGAVPAGTIATLVFRLVNNDSDRSSKVTLATVALPTDGVADAATKFFVVDDGTDRTYRYGVEGLDSGTFATTNSGNASGVASNPAGDRVWVVDAATKQISVFGPSGAGLGSWTASDAVNPQGVTVDNGTLWLVDRGSNSMRRYAGGAGRTTETASATDSFVLDAANAAPSDLVTDGSTIWVTDDAAAKVFVYDVSGSLLGQWQLDGDNAAPSGITRNPAGGTDLWVLDRATKQVFQYALGANLRNGSHAANGTFNLAPGNSSPEGIADPPAVNAFFNDPAGFAAAAGDPPVVVSFDQIAAGTDVTGRMFDGVWFDRLGGGAPLMVVRGVDTVTPDRFFGLALPASQYRLLPTSGANVLSPGGLELAPGPAPAVEGDGVVMTFARPVAAVGFDVLFQSRDASSFTGVRVYSPAGELLYRNDQIPTGDTSSGGGPSGPVFVGFVADGAVIGRVEVDDRDNDAINPDSNLGYDSIRFHRFAGPLALELDPPPADPPPGGEVVLTGRATADAPGAAVTQVTVNGVPVDALDAEGRFYARVRVAAGENGYEVVAYDSLGQTATAVTTVRSAAGAGVELSQLVDLATAFRAEYARTSFRDESRTLFADVAVRNISQYPAGVPLYVGVKNISDPAVRVLNAVGTLPDGTPYYDFTSVVSGGAMQLAPDAATGTLSLTFSNPNRSRFTYELVFLGVPNRSPAFTTIPGLEGTVGREYAYLATARDPDNDPLTYTVQSGPVGMTVNPATGELTWTPTAEQVGNFPVTVRVTDRRGSSSEQSFNVESVLNRPNRPPLFVGTPVMDVELGSDYWYAALARDPDSDRLTYALTTAPVGMTIDPVTGAIIWTPIGSQVGHADVTVSVTDGRGGMAMQSFEVCVSVNANRPPVIVSTPVTAVAAGDPAGYAYVVTAADPDGGPLTFTLLVGPAGMALDPQTGRLTWMPGVGADGQSFAVAVRADDGRGGADEQRFTVTVARGGVVRGTVWEDGDGDGVRGAGEAGAGGRTVYLDRNGNGWLDPEDAAAVTTPGGGYELAAPAGGWVVRLDGQPNRATTSPAGGEGVAVTVTAGGTAGADFGAARTAGELVVNGGFEQGPEPGLFLTYGAGSTAIPGWVVTRDTVDYEGLNWAELDGTRSIDLSGTPGAGAIAQTIRTTPGARYAVEFDLGGNMYGGPAVKAMWVSAAGQSAEFTFDTAGSTPAAMNWRRVRWEFTAVAAATVLEFASLVLSTYGPVIDRVSVVVAVTPTPGPRFTAAPAGAASAGTPYRSAAALTVPAGGPLAFDLVAAPAGMAVNPTLGVVAWVPPRDQVGTHRAVLRATDRLGNVALLPFDVTVAAPDTAPLFATAAPVGPAATGTRYEYRAAAQDAEGGSLTYALVNPLPGMAVDPATGVFTWTPTADQVGSATVILRASDGTLTADQTFALTVLAAAANRDPVLRTEMPAKAWLGRGYVARIIATDPDGDPVRYALVSGPTGMAVDAVSGLVTWAPTDLGTHTVRVSATDGRGGSVAAAVTVTVVGTDADRRPVVVSTPPPAAVVGAVYAYDLAARDPDGDPVAWELVTGPQGMSVDSIRGTLRWVPAADQIGAVSVTVRATDPAGAAGDQTFTVAVSCSNAPPVITSRPPGPAYAGYHYLYAVRATDSEGDPLAFNLDQAPAGMAFVPGTSLLRWIPLATDAGPHPVVLRVTDRAGNVATQAFTLEVSTETPDRPPVITSRPPLGATLDRPYAYAVAARDDDGDPLTFALDQAPPGMAIDPSTGVITWAPAAATQATVTVRVGDGRGGTAMQSFVVTARANRPPVIDPLPDATAALGGTFRAAVRAIDPEGDPLAYVLDQAPPGMTIDADGRILWTPIGSPRSERVRVQVTDADGLAATAEFTLTLATDSQAPRVTLRLHSTAVALGGTVRVSVRATDDVGVATLRLSVSDGTTTTQLALDAAGGAVFTAATAGRYSFTATAIDAAGNVGTATAELRAFDSAAESDVRASFTRLDELTAPGQHLAFVPPDDLGNPVPQLSYRTDVYGSVSAVGRPLASWRLLVARGDQVDLFNSNPDDPAWREIARGTGSVTDGKLGTFDPTELANDRYVLLLVAYDVTGAGYFRPTQVDVVGEAKLGNFRLAATDLTLPLAGIPVTVGRTYDTLDAGAAGDFGYGWTLAAADPRIRESVPQTGDGFFTTGAAFRDGTKVYLTGPDGKRVGFTFHPVPTPSFFGAAFRPAFTPDPGVTSRLAVDPITLTQNADGTFKAFLFGFPYNPDNYRLTTKDGLTYAYDQSAGLQSVSDRNGVTLTYTRDGIFSSTGVAVRFVRDGADRITQVIDPDGNATRYRYDAAGNLAAVTDRTGLTTTYTYRATPAHYLDEARDPLGRLLAKAEYDATGRLAASTDAQGNRTAFGYDPDQFTETVADALGNVTTLGYDARGNVVRETDPLGHTTRREYDAADNEVATADPLGRVTRRTFDARRNLLSEKDTLGGVSRYTYDDRNDVTTVTDPLGRLTTFLFDADGNPAGSVDALGNRTTRTNDADGRPLTETDARGFSTAYEYVGGAAGPTKVTHPDGTFRTIVYSLLGLPVRITDEGGEQLALEYDGSGRLLSVTAPDGGVTRYAYTGDLLTTQTDPLGVVILYAYDAANRLVSKSDALGGITRYAYDDAGRLVSTTDPLGHATGTAYDAAGRVLSVTDAAGGVTAYEYDAAGNRTAVIDADGNRANYTFDELNRLVRKDDCPCPDETYAYDAVGNLASVTDKRGFVTRYAYDALDRLVSETDALGGLTRYAYDTNGNVTTVTDALGRTTTSAYDARNRLVRQIDPAGYNVAYGYDGAGNQTSATDQLGFVTRFAYDGLGRLLATTDALGGLTANAYDRAGNLISVTDPLGHVTRYRYDELKRLTATTDANGGVVRYEYDAAGNRTALTDPVGNRTTFGYDAANRQVRETDPLGHSILSGYDAVGNRTSVTDRNGRLRTFAYDELNRLDTETWWDGTTAVRVIRSTYDSVGNLTGISDPDATYDFTYDALNRQVTADNAGTPNAPHVVLTSTYDAVGNRIEVKDNAGVTVGSTYDARDLLVTRTWQGGGVSAARLDFGYDARGLRTSVARAADLTGAAVVSRSVLGYDELGRETSYAHSRSGGSAVSDYGYTYDAAHRLIREVRNGITIDYSYDQIDQLLGANRATGPDEAYDFDAAGNREGGGYQTETGNRLTSDGRYTYAHDTEGNLVRKTEIATGAFTDYAYDHRNRLVSVMARAAGGAVVSEVRYTYDALDRRIATTTNGVRATTVHDGDSTWADYDAAATETARYLTGDVIDEMLARFRPGEGTAWYLTDKLGSVRELLGPTGVVLNRIDYDSFGRILTQTNPAVRDRFTFTGREFDAATGLYYYRARFFDPNVGRFISEDPIRFNSGDQNLSRYVSNSPLMFVDPTGFLEFIESGGQTNASLAALSPIIIQTSTAESLVAGNVTVGVFTTGTNPITAFVLRNLGKLTGFLSEVANFTKAVGATLRIIKASTLGDPDENCPDKNNAPQQPARSKGDRLKSGDDALQQLEEIERAQRRVRQVKSPQIIDSIEKSKQRLKCELRRIRSMSDLEDM